MTLFPYLTNFVHIFMLTYSISISNIMLHHFLDVPSLYQVILVVLVLRVAGKSAFVLFYDMKSSVQYEVSVI